MFDILDLDRGIDPALERDLLHRAIGIGDRAGHLLLRLDRVQPLDRHAFLARQAQRLAGVTAGELERDNTHANEVGAVDAFETFGDHGLDAQQVGALGGPVAAGPGAVLFPAEDDKRRPLFLVGHGGIIDRGLFAVGALGITALDTVQHLVLDADIGECAAHHHLVVAAPAAVGVELAHRHLPLDQVFARRGGFLEAARRADVVGGHHVAQNRQNARALDVGDRARILAHTPEIGRVLDVGRGSGPVIRLATGHLDALPHLVALEDIGVLRLERLARDGLFDQFGDFLLGRPDVLHVDIVAVLVLTQRFGRQVDIHVAGERIGDDKRRRG